MEFSEATTAWTARGIRRTCTKRVSQSTHLDADQGVRSNAYLGLFLAVLLDVSLHCLFSVPSGVNHVAPRRVCMVCCLLVVSGIVMLGGFLVVPCGVREMF